MRGTIRASEVNICCMFSDTLRASRPLNPSVRLSDTLLVVAGRDLQRLCLNWTPSSFIEISKMVTLPSEIFVVATEHPVQKTDAGRILHSNHDLFMRPGKAIKDEGDIFRATGDVILWFVRIDDRQAVSSIGLIDCSFARPGDLVGISNILIGIAWGYIPCQSILEDSS